MGESWERLEGIDGTLWDHRTLGLNQCLAKPLGISIALKGMNSDEPLFINDVRAYLNQAFDRKKGHGVSSNVDWCCQKWAIFFCWEN